jgi:hypothetical protein
VVKARYLVATTTSSYASLLILDTGQPVMTLGGYQGWDRILTRSQLSQLASKGTIRFFLLPASGADRSRTGLAARASGTSSRFMGSVGITGLPGGVDANLTNVNNDLITWVQAHCTAVPSSAYQTASRQSSSVGRSSVFGSFGDAGQLYDCAAGARAPSGSHSTNRSDYSRALTAAHRKLIAGVASAAIGRHPAGTRAMEGRATRIIQAR